MGYLGNCRDLGQTVAEIQARLPAQLDARCEAAGRAGRHRPSDSDSPFRPPPNYAGPSGLYSPLSELEAPPSWKPGGKLSAVLAALLLAASGAAQATIINARSPSLADVSTAVASAVKGDTVIVPAGTASWTSTLVINKGITLVGQTTTDSVAGTATDKTIIRDNLPRGAGSMPIIKIVSVLGTSYRVSGLTFQGLATGTNYNGAVVLSGNSHAVRLDHCHFQPIPAQSIYVAITGAIYGVADHNVLECPHVESFTFYMPNWPYPDGTPGLYGDGSWATPTNFGSEKFFFVEDNYIKNVTGAIGGGPTDDTFGGRWVFRYNHCYDSQTQTHGTETGRIRGGRAREIYHNDFHNTFAHDCGGIRSGVTITHDNTWDGVKPTAGLILEAYRALVAGPGESFRGGTGDNLWDVDVTEANGTNVPGNVPCLYESGTVSGGSSTTLVDTTKNWATNKWAGFTAKRLSDGKFSFIISNTSNTLTVIYTTASGGSAIWAAGDQYQIHRALVLIDQPGRGQGDLITGTTPINSTTGTATWPHEALEPTYSWNDKYTPTNTSVNSKSGSGNLYIQLPGRDFYNNTPMPGYTPYIYPHPLVSGVASSPSAPQNLRVTGP